MYQIVERSISLWKAQHGPFRVNVGNHLNHAIKPYSPFDVRPEHPFYIDYTDRKCDWA